MGPTAASSLILIPSSCKPAAGVRPTRCPPWTAPSPGHRSPRCLRRAARAHAGGLPPGHRAGCRRHRARPGADEGWHRGGPPRAHARQHHGCGQQVSGFAHEHEARGRRGDHGLLRRRLHAGRAQDPACRAAARPQGFDGLYAIPTLEEIITLAKTEGARLGRTVGIDPEIKHSTFHAVEAGFGANISGDELLALLHLTYGNTASAPVHIQSVEVANLQYLNGRTEMRLVQLIDADDVRDDGSLSLVAP